MSNFSDALREKINKQIGHENHNRNIYLSFYNKFKVIGLDNIAEHFLSQANGEADHQRMIVDYASQRNESIEMLSVDPVEDVDSIPVIAQKYLEIEQGTTQLLKEIVKQAWDDMDYMSYNFFQTMVIEQQEEESVSQTFLDQITNIGDNMAMLQLYNNSFKL